MIKLIKKVQQNYIDAKLREDKVSWCKVEGGVLLTLNGYALYHIPAELLHVKLDEAEHSTALKKIVEADDSYLPAEYRGTTKDGWDVFKAGDLIVIADHKKAKIFTDVKDATFKIKAKNMLIRCYSAGGQPLGGIMPLRQEPGRNYDI